MNFAPAKHGTVFCIVLVSIVALLSSFSGNCFAQSDSLDVLQDQWSELEEKFAQQKTAMESGEGDTKAQLDQYRDLLDQADDLIGRMKTAALNDLSENAEDKSAIRALMGLLLHEAANGRDGEVLTIGDTLIEKNIDPRYFEVAAKADRLSIDAKEIFEELLIRLRESEADDLPRVKLTTSKGDIIVELYEDQAPNTVANFISLVESGYYSDLLFHRVLEDFMAQTGGFKSDGSGGSGPGYSIECECYTPDARPHFSNCLSMAHAGKDTGGGQFFLTFSRTDFLDGMHTCFGRVISGADVLDNVERTHISINGAEQPIPNIEKDKIISAEVIRKRDHEYKPKKVGEEDSKPAPKLDAPPRDPNLTQPETSDDESSNDDDAASGEESAGDTAGEDGDL